MALGRYGRQAEKKPQMLWEVLDLPRNGFCWLREPAELPQIPARVE